MNILEMEFHEYINPNVSICGQILILSNILRQEFSYILQACVFGLALFKCMTGLSAPKAEFSVTMGAELMFRM